MAGIENSALVVSQEMQTKMYIQLKSISRFCGFRLKGNRNDGGHFDGMVGVIFFSLKNFICTLHTFFKNSLKRVNWGG